MGNPETIVVVGAGLAGVSAAGALREAGFGGRIVLIGGEAEIPYDRPPLSKAVLVGSELAALGTAGGDAALAVPPALALRPADWYGQQRIECLFGSAAQSLDVAAHAVQLEGAAPLRYDRLILATGATARRLPDIESGDASVHYLRTLRDAVALRAHLVPRQRVALIGGGVIGMEVAASARQLGCDVVVLELAPRIMARGVPPALGEHIAARHRTAGVALRLGTAVAGPAPRGTKGLRLRDGSIVAADVIVVGIGVLANTALAEAAGVTCRDGIVVDEFGATSAADVFAAGDVARYPDAFLGVDMRGENWMHAQNHAVTAARNALGMREPYRAVPFMWSDQYDLKIQVTGRFDTPQHLLRGDPSTQRFMWLHLDDGRVRGASGINQARDMRFAQRLVESGRIVPPEQLADPGVNLKTLAE